MTLNAPRIYKSGEFHWVGDGFPVRSVFGYNDLGKELSPFLLLDYAAPYNFTPSTTRRGVGEHPHRGFETVTLAYQGEIEHRDSSGGGGKIGPGDVQWMTAARGLVHEELHSKEFTENGGTFEMVQLWVNLPAKYKNSDPRYQTIPNTAMPRIQLANDAGEVKIIAGSLDGITGPAKTFTSINLWDVQIDSGKTAQIDLPDEHTKAILVLRGEIRVDQSLANAKDGDLIVLDRNKTKITLDSDSSSKLLILTGQPINEPIVGYGPFVMNTEDEIKQAFADFKMGKLGRLDSD